MTGLSESDRNALVEILTDLGAGPDDIPTDPDDFAPFASDLVLGRDDIYSLRDLATDSGVDIAVVSELFNHLGVSIDDPDEVILNNDDKALTSFVMTTIEEVLFRSEGVEIMHVAGNALESLAEAAVASHVQGPESRSADTLDNTLINARITEIGLQLGEQLPVIFRHHLRQAAQRQRRTQSLSHREHVLLTVGFIDLVGFTSLTQVMAPDALVQLVKGFEARAHELAHVHQARVVKLIGDEVMFVAESPISAAQYAVGLLTAFQDDDTTPRGGMAMGPLVNLHGDYFGPIVNLAARLVDEAVPGELLITEELAAIDGIHSEPAGRRKLRGFDSPIRVASLEYDESPNPDPPR